MLNYTTILGTLFMVLWRLRRGLYNPTDLMSALGHHMLTLVVMFVTGIVLIAFITYFNLIMAWYAMPELVFPIYVLPMLSSALWVHIQKAENRRVSLSLVLA
jgi:hypothetical protein